MIPHELEHAKIVNDTARGYSHLHEAFAWLSAFEVLANMADNNKAGAAYVLASRLHRESLLLSYGLAVREGRVSYWASHFSFDDAFTAILSSNIRANNDNGNIYAVTAVLAAMDGHIQRVDFLELDGIWKFGETFLS